MDSEQKRIKTDFKKFLSLITWFEAKSREHNDNISIYKKEISKNEKKMADYTKDGKSLLVKKLKLKMNRLRNEIQNKQNHYMEDHDRIVSILDDLESLKKELESHADHQH
jgi:chromosome segregation ATPase